MEGRGHIVDAEALHLVGCGFSVDGMVGQVIQLVPVFRDKDFEKGQFPVALRGDLHRGELDFHVVDPVEKVTIPFLALPPRYF